MRVLAPAGVSFRILVNDMTQADTTLVTGQTTYANHIYRWRTECPGSTRLCWFPCGSDSCEIMMMMMLSPGLVLNLGIEGCHYAYCRILSPTSDPGSLASFVLRLGH